MPIPLPALDVQPPKVADPMDQYTKLSNLKYLQQAQPLELEKMRLGNQEATYQMGARAAVNDAYRSALKINDDGSTDIDGQELTKHLATAGYGAEAPSILKGINDFKKSQMDLQEAHQKIATQAKDSLGALGYAIKQANYDPNLTDVVLQREIANNQGNPQVLRQLQQLEAITKQKPEAIKPLIDNMIAQSPKQQELANQRESADARGGPAMALYRSRVANGEDPNDVFKDIQDMMKKETGLENKKAFQDIVSKMAAGGMKIDPTKVGPSDLEKALSQKIITEKDRNDAIGYLAANNTPANQVSVSIKEAAGKESIKDAKNTYAYTDSNGDLQYATGDKLPKDADAVYPIKDPKSELGAAKAMNLVQTSFTNLAKQNQKIFDNPAARMVLTTALDDQKARSMGILVAGTGGSLTLPSGSGHIIDQLLENNAVPKDLRSDVKKYIVAHYAMKDKLITLQMALQGGKIGRGAFATIQPMFNQIPGITTADSAMADEQLHTMQQFISGAKSNWPDKYGTYEKEPDYDFKGGKSYEDQFPDHK